MEDEPNERISAGLILGDLCQIVVNAWPVKRNRACMTAKLFVCMLCARSLKVQRLSFKENNYSFF